MRGDDRRANQGLEPVSIRVDPQTSPTQRASAVEAARRFAEGRAGIVAFAMIDRSGNQVDRFGDRSFVSASVVKALLLVAELDRLERENLPLDPTTRSLLTQMITVSDNSAADAIYGRVGDGGLEAVARDARLKTFSVDGYWANAQITASDMARFADGLDAVLKGPHEKFGNGLLQNVVNWQRWGIPAAAGEAWRIRFKGGWRSTDLGALAHQIARLDGHGKHLSLAVLTDGQTSHEYATETVEGVAARLLAPLNRAR